MKIKLTVMGILLILLIPTVSVLRAASPKPEGTLVAVLSTLGGEMLIPFMGTSSNKSHGDLLYDYLIELDSQGKMAPGLATKWTLSKDHKVWTFDLRKGVKFHNGDEMTAEDVKYSIELVASNDSRLSRNFELQKTLDRIDVVNPYRLVVHTKIPYPLDDLLSLSYAVGIVSKKYIEKVGMKYAAEHPVGTGPARFVDRKLGEYIKLEAVDQHWRTVPQFKTFILKQVPEHTTRVAMLRTGEADIIDLPSFMVDAVKKAGLDVRMTPMSFSTWITLGGQYLPKNPVYDPKTPWLKKQVRQALNLALNREEIARYIFKGTAQPGVLPYFMPGTLGWDDSWKPYPYDPEKAKKLLADAGYPKGFDMTMRSFSMSGVPELPEMAEAVATYWAKIGVRVKLAPMDYTSHRPDYQNSRLPAVAFPFRFTFQRDVVSRMVKGFTSEAKGTHAEAPYLDALGAQLSKEIDPIKQLELVRKFGQYLYDEYMVVPVVYTSMVYGVSNKIGNWPVVFGLQHMHHLELIAHRRR